MNDPDDVEIDVDAAEVLDGGTGMVSTWFRVSGELMDAIPSIDDDKDND